jgi:hypothetical protein
VTEPAQGLPAFDAPALIARVRGGDEAALRQAYVATFGHELGRLVLAHHLSDCGVGRPLGRDDNLRYVAGRHDAAIDLASKAGFDEASLSVAVLSDQLEGADYDGSSYGRPDGDDIHLDD